MYGIQVNVDAIAQGMLEMVPDLGENYEAALQLGMLPAPLMDILHKQLADKFDQLAVKHSKMADTMAELGFPEYAEEMRREITEKREKWVRHVEHEVSAAMYKHASILV